MKYRIMLPILLMAAFSVSVSAEGNPEKGKQVFRRCMSCHTVGDGARHRAGPELNGVVGSEIASAEGYSYSKAFLAKKEEEFVWTEENLDLYLTKPATAINGTKMAFAGLPKEEDRENVIAYLASFSCGHCRSEE